MTDGKCGWSRGLWITICELRLAHRPFSYKSELRRANAIVLHSYATASRYLFQLLLSVEKGYLKLTLSHSQAWVGFMLLIYDAAG